MDAKCIEISALGRPLYPGMLYDCRSDSFIPVMDAKCIEISALGRPLYPGMLYDCRSDSFIPGVTLWDKESLNKDLDVRQQPKTDLKFSCSDSLNDKTNCLDLSASLKASFLCGLVEVEGSAKYLNDKRSSMHQTRVTMQYSQTTRFEQLTMSQLGNITYPQVFEEKSASHVITAVLYGAHAFLVFDHTTTKKVDKQEIEGKLHVMVKKIPFLSIEGKGSLKLDDEEKNVADKINCTFHGDYLIEENPTTYTEAIQLYKKLPTLLKNNDNNAVPVKIWLYPLERLNTKAARLERETSSILSTKIVGLLDTLENGERISNDLIKNSTICGFQDLLERLKSFKAFLHHYKLLFQTSLRRFLPEIRGGMKKEEEFLDVLIIHSKTSPFTDDKMNKWINNFQSELNLLDSYTKELSGCPVVTYSVLNEIVFNPTTDIVICFSFTSLNQDPYLSTMDEYLKADEFEKLSALPQSNDQDHQSWKFNADISDRMRENLSLFKGFSEANKENNQIRCVIAAVSDPSNPGTSLRLYRKGKMVNSNFQPVSKPPAPSGHIQNRNVILKLQKSPTGKTLRYRVEYKADTAADAEAWKVVDTPDTEETFTLTGVQLASKNWVRYRAVSEVGVSEASDSVLFSHEEKLNVPVAKSWNWTALSLFNELRKTISLDTSYWSPSTIKSEVRTLLNMINSSSAVQLPGVLKQGQALYFQGVIPSRFKRFIIDLNTKDGTAFHFSSFTDHVVCDSLRAGKWENQYNINWTPFVKGMAFDMFMVITPEGYEVIVNGQRFCMFTHRMPLETVSELTIYRDIVMNTFGIIENWSTSTFFKELSSGTSRGKSSNIQSEVAHPVCNPLETYSGQIPEGLQQGKALYFQGVIPSDFNRFTINLKTGPKDDDIAFHFSSLTDHVVCDSFRAGKWEKQYNINWTPFVKGGAFDMFMVITPEGYEVIVNGQNFCMFNHRMPLETVSVLEIWGDVFMNTFGIIEVDNVNLNVLIPAHI